MTTMTASAVPRPTFRPAAGRVSCFLRRPWTAFPLLLLMAPRLGPVPPTNHSSNYSFGAGWYSRKAFPAAAGGRC